MLVHLFIATLRRLLMSGLYRDTLVACRRRLTSAFFNTWLVIMCFYVALNDGALEAAGTIMTFANSPALPTGCDIDVETLSREDVSEASRSYGTLAFNEIWMGLNRHEPWATVTNLRSCLQVGGSSALTRYSTQIVLLCCSGEVGYRMYVKLFGASRYRIDYIMC